MGYYKSIGEERLEKVEVVGEGKEEEVWWCARERERTLPTFDWLSFI